MSDSGFILRPARPAELDVVGRLIGATDPDAFIRAYEASIHHRAKK